MPRQARLDAPDLLQHVMARGIERRDIFRDDKDRKSFLIRLALILEETQAQCYAWALIPNHFHLLLRTGTTPLSKIMRRLMTGYAVAEDEDEVMGVDDVESLIKAQKKFQKKDKTGCT